MGVRGAGITNLVVVGGEKERGQEILRTMCFILEPCKDVAKVFIFFSLWRQLLCFVVFYYVRCSYSLLTRISPDKDTDKKKRQRKRRPRISYVMYAYIDKQLFPDT